MRVVAENYVTDTHILTLTHGTATVTLAAHARRELIISWLGEGKVALKSQVSHPLYETLYLNYLKVTIFSGT